MGMRIPETCWAVSKRRAINLRDWCVWLVVLFELYLYVMHWLKAVYCMVPEHEGSQKIIRDGSKLQRWMHWGDLREYQEKKEIKYVTIRQQIGLEETSVKEIEQNQLTWYGRVQRMAEGRLSKIALKWMPKQKRTRGRPKKSWIECIRKAMNERNLIEGQWEDRKQWNLGVGQRTKKFWNRYIYI